MRMWAKDLQLSQLIHPSMQSRTRVTAALLLSCLLFLCPHLSDGQTTRSRNASRPANVSNVVYRVNAQAGNRSTYSDVPFRMPPMTGRNFNVDETINARIVFQPACSSTTFSRLYMKYQLVLPMYFYIARFPSQLNKRITFTELKVKPDKDLSSWESGLSVKLKLKSDSLYSYGVTFADLIFLCNSFLRCRYLSEEIVSNPADIRRALEFQLVGRVGNRPASFDIGKAVNQPSLTCDRYGWVVFHRRVDGSLSFAQNWDAYVKGFGNPSANYWMGLDRLSEMTVTSDTNQYQPSSRCRLRIETVDFKGNMYSTEFKMFEVLGPEQNYRLRIGQQVDSSELGNRMMKHNELPFSSFDRDNDVWVKSCSQAFGYGGWWYDKCHSVNLHGAYTTDQSVTDNPAYNTIFIRGRHLPMKQSVMKFRCH